MTRSSLLVLASLVTSTCGDNTAPAPPLRLWLDLDGSELRVRLVEDEPIPF